MPTKRCSTCKAERGLKHFYKNRSQKDGRHNQCTDCHGKNRSPEMKALTSRRYLQREQYRPVSEQDRTILQLLAEDKNLEQVADAMNLSKAWVQVRHRILKKKLQVRTQTGLIGAAYKKGLL